VFSTPDSLSVWAVFLAVLLPVGYAFLGAATPGEMGEHLRETIIISGDYYIEENLTLEGDNIFVASSSSNPITIQINASYTVRFLNCTISSTDGYFRIVSYGRLIMKNTTVSNFGYWNHQHSIIIKGRGSLLENCTFRNFTTPITFSSTSESVIKDCLFVNYTGTPWVYTPPTSVVEAAVYIYFSWNITISGNRIVDVKGGDGQMDRTGNGIQPPITSAVMMEFANNVTLEKNSIEGVRGGDGGNAGLNGEPAMGGAATGMSIFRSGDVVVWDNVISNVRAGDAGVAALGSTIPSRGGSAYGIFLGYNLFTHIVVRHNAISRIYGGNGTTLGGVTGGGGGEAIGIFLYYILMYGNATVEDCVITDVHGGNGGVPSKDGYVGGSASGIGVAGDGTYRIRRNDIYFVKGGKGAGNTEGGRGGGIWLTGLEYIEDDARLEGNYIQFIRGGDGGYNPIGVNASGGEAFGISLWGYTNITLLSCKVNDVVGGTGGTGGISIDDYAPGYGIRLSGCRNGSVEFCYLEQCFSYGLYLVNTSGFEVYRNVLKQNNRTGDTFNSSLLQAYDDSPGRNRWNTSELYFHPITLPGTGNYFMDWALNNRSNDRDGDGRVDWPYPIAGGDNMDHFPLTSEPLNFKPYVTITNPTNGSYTSETLLQVSWIMKSLSPISALLICVDDGGFLRLRPGTTTHTIRSLSEGVHVVEVVVVTENGYYDMDQVTFYVDLTPPEVSILQPEGPFVNSTPLVIWRIFDNFGVANLTLLWDSNMIYLDPAVTAYPVEFTTSGNHTIQVIAEDLAGNRGSDERTVVADLDPPLVNITRPEEGAHLTTTEVVVSWTGEDPTTDIARYLITLDDGDPIDVGTATEHTFSDVERGEHTVTVVAYDMVNNTGEDSVSFTVSLPAPEELSVQIISPQEGAHHNSSQVLLVWNGSGLAVGYRIYVDGGEPLDVGNVTVHTLTLSEGEHHLIVEAYDSLNNTAADQVNFTVDLTPPAVHVDAFWGAVNPGESLTIHFSASDNFALSHVVVEVIYLNGTEIEYRYEDNFDRLSFTFPTFNTTGMHILQIFAWDMAGNTNSSHRMGIKVTWDTDFDGMDDRWEREHGLDPSDKNDASLDPDGDGLTNLEEYLNGTNPQDEDSDDDGFTDGREVEEGTNPNDPSSHPEEEEAAPEKEDNTLLYAAIGIILIAAAAAAILLSRRGGEGFEE